MNNPANSTGTDPHDCDARAEAAYKEGRADAIAEAAEGKGPAAEAALRWAADRIDRWHIVPIDAVNSLHQWAEQAVAE